MASFPRVISPIRTLFTRDRIEIALISVELWPKHVVLRLAALPNEIADDRLRQHNAAFAQWGHLLVQAGKGVAGDPPEQPGTRLLAPLDIALKDDAGTTYAPCSSNIGGSGSEWHGDWFFSGDVPASVRRLTVQVSSPEGEAATVVLDLASS